ncbi:MAG: twin-arginine translocase subunit TatC [Pirellulaceae bacterium]|nr:twin-arginine translocase subunit TatC [Pirellulaceae bacterium]
MAKRPADDLFADSTMTFGEHLEELRVILFRALIGLFAGFLIGLLLANYVVRWIEVPLQKALLKYNLAFDMQRLKESTEGELPAGIEAFMKRHALTYEDVYIEPDEVQRLSGLMAEWSETSPGQREATEGEAQPGFHEETADQTVGAILPPPRSLPLRTRLWKPLRTRITSLSAHEAFMIWLKAGFVSGLVVASPWIFWQIWIFVGAGLYPHEKRYVYVFLPLSIFLFLLGAATAFFFVFEPVLDFLFSFNAAMNIYPDLRISEWISFVLFLPLGFGIAFQLPLVMLFLNRIGIVSLDLYVQKWRIAILVIFVLSMFLTPADPISMLLMACPLTVLYFLGIALCRWMPKWRNPFEEGYDPA